jgi:hypothetical protein
MEFVGISGGCKKFGRRPHNHCFAVIEVRLRQDREKIIVDPFNAGQSRWTTNEQNVFHWVSVFIFREQSKAGGYSVKNRT